MTPCVLENDGMSLKPSIECDSRLKENFELKKFKFDLAYVKERTDPSADDLRNNIITEAIVSSLTNLDKKFSLPCAVDYATQKGKTGEAMANEFEIISRQFRRVSMPKERTRPAEYFKIGKHQM